MRLTPLGVIVVFFVAPALAGVVAGALLGALGKLTSAW